MKQDGVGGISHRFLGRLADGMILSCCDGIREALSYGVAGFIPKSARKSDLAAAIRSVMDGAVSVPEGQLLDPDSTDRADMVQRLARLTPQQLRVLQMLHQGMLNKQIAH